MAGLTKTKDDVTANLTAMISRARQARGGLARLYTLYQKLQTERFVSENASQGAPWPPLSAEYARYKPRRYGGGPRRKSRKRDAGTWSSYPGGGRKMLIGTGMLAGAVIGPGSPFAGNSNHRAMFTDTEMVISVEMSGTNPDGEKFEYAKYVAEHRPFMTFSQASLDQMQEKLRKYILGRE